MKMFKRGFTLAEVLISLAIVGVIASMTLPNLNANIQKRQIEANFQRFISQIENANALFMADENTRTLKAAVGDTTAGQPTWADTKLYIEAIQPYLRLSTGNNPTVTYRKFNGQQYTGTSHIISANNASYYVFKDGTMSLWPRQGVIDANYDNGYYILCADLNGPNKGPNYAGKDFFWFVVDRRDGKVYGWGTNKLQIFTVGNQANNHNSATKCPSNQVPNSGVSCTGSIMDNGGKITYKGF